MEGYDPGKRGRLTEVEVCAGGVTCPDTGDPAANVRQRREDDHHPPDPAIGRQAVEQSPVQRQETGLDAPGNRPEKRDNHELISDVDVTFVEEGLACGHAADGDVDQVVQRVGLQGLEDGVDEEEREGGEHPVVVGVETMGLRNASVDAEGDEDAGETEARPCHGVEPMRRETSCGAAELGFIIVWCSSHVGWSRT